MRPVRIVLAAAFGLALLASSATSAIGQMTLPPTQEGVYVYDLADIWGSAARTEAQQIANDIRARTQAQLAIVSWPSDDFDVSTETARTGSVRPLGAVDATDVTSTRHSSGSGSR